MASGWMGLGQSAARTAGRAACFVASLICLSAALHAEDPAAPARAVRLSYVDGRVQVSQDGQVLADPAVFNTPLFEGAQVVTTDDGRAEIQFEDGSVARISPNSSITLTALKPDGGAGSTEVRLDGGLGYFEIQAGGDPGHMQIRFGDALVTASGFTVMRVDLDNLPGELAVFSGNAHLDRGDALSLDLHGGESLALNATPSEYNLAETIEPDSWDNWNSDRDQVLNSEAASRTAATNSFSNSSNPAWNDLDANGSWYNVPDQGYVWSPYDASNSGWDPYGNGYWMWTPTYGYIWASGDSWGYMTASCGLWNFYSGFGWGWAPGAGGCSPWWGGGLYIVNIGYAPSGYLPPRIPRRLPPHPVRPGGRPQPVPLIVVNKRPPSKGMPALGARDHSTPVTIAGHVVTPARPIAPRLQYERTSTGLVTRPGPGGNGGVTVITGTAPRPVFSAPAPRPAPAPSGSGYRPPAPSHMAPPPAPHVSSGGGGGGGHPSAGGGGGSAHH
jgi:hypothetical protein